MQNPPTGASPAQGSGQDGGTILLPPVPQTGVPPETGSRPRRGWGNSFLTLLVLILAFLTASSLARNSDVWFHLATGRLLVERQFSIGTDPFAYTTEGAYWVCHSWLADLAAFEIYTATGGTGLVVFKALLVAALAGLLLLVRRPGSSVWLPVVCTTLATVAMSPRLLLQPACTSYFFLGVTFWLLWRQNQAGSRMAEPAAPSSAPIDDRQAKICRVLLLLTFAAWVNMDEWFLLGLVLAALFFLGERLEGQRRTPNWLVPAGLAACLVNPFTYHAFTLPSELSTVAWTSGLREDPRFQALFASPWSYAYPPTAGLHPAAVAYFALTVLGLVSFLIHRPALRDWRLVVWLPFALLAAWQARAIPFFVVVAAPITALNWQDFLAGRPGMRKKKDGSRRQIRLSLFLIPSYFLLALALVALSALTWLGWLTGASRDGRQVGWGLQPDPSLQRATEALHDWRRQGLLPVGQRVFAVSPEVAQYGAWFAPGEKFFFDHRYQLFPTAARDYEVVCRGLIPDLGPSDEREKDWRQVLLDNGVGVIIYSDREPQRLFAVLRRVAEDPEHWTLLDVAGQALVVGWIEARPPGVLAALAFDADRLAFGPPDERTRRALPPAPERGPEHLPPPRDFRARAIRLPATPSWESAAATLYLHYADDNEVAQRQRQLQSSLCGYAASLAGLPALPAAFPPAAFQLVSAGNLLFPTGGAPSFLVREQLGPFFAHLVQRSPALPLLAVRAARQAASANSEDANAWLRLGQAYVLLRNATGEGSAYGLLPPLAHLRHVQIATALEQAVRLDPDLEVAHSELAYLYGERNYLDQSLEHRQEEVRLSRRAGPRPGESADELADRLEFLDKDTAKLVKLVEERRRIYASASRPLQGDRLAQAGLALRLGLVRQAVDEILLNSPADLLGSTGIKLELDLLLCLGRADEVRAILDDEVLRAKKHGLHYHDLLPPRGSDGEPLYAIPYHWPAYEWLHVLQTAAVGDYAEAGSEMRVIRSGLKAGHQMLREQHRAVENHLWQFVGGLLSGPRPFLPEATAEILGPYLENRTALQTGEPTLRAQQADLSVLEGLLALEQGDTPAARAAFVEARDLCTSPAGAAIPFAGAPIVALYLGKLNGQRE
jgi:tetratricopeptide (TPR) repeat protein